MKRIALFAMLCALPAAAHKASDSYLSLRVDGPKIEGRWDIALRDAAEPLDLDGNGDGAITWGELKAREPQLATWALSRLRVESDGQKCGSGPVDLQVDDHSDGAYAVLGFTLECPSAPSRLTISYRLLFDRDALHRGLLNLQAHGVTQTAVFSPGAISQGFSIDASAPLRQMAAFLREGATHIWSGFDHVLFLLALLLPAVLRRHEGRWIPVASFRPALSDATKVVTAFTVAHSITLSASVLGLVRLPSRFVEAGIALSVAVAALDNLVPVFRARRWAVAFAFGLLHGFGFASVLVDMGLPRVGLLRALFSFNLGVEFGQLVIVVAFLTGAYVLRRSPGYQRLALKAGSLAIMIVAGVWFFERLFGMRLLPGA